MSLLAKLGARGGGVTRTRVGEVVVVHAVGGVTAQARAIAESLPADPEHELVVADLPAAAPAEVWKAFAGALPRGRGPLRVVPARPPHEIAPAVGQWLADHTQRAVVAPYGPVTCGTGWLFAGSVSHGAWVTYRLGVPPAWQGMRFPRPGWESIEVSRVASVGFRGVVEPLPAGVWLRPDVGDGVLATARTRLTWTLPCLPDALTIVVGVPDATDLDLGDIAAFWRTLPPRAAATARLVQFGGVALPDGVAVGQALADTLGAEVRCYSGVPTGTPEALTVVASRQDGSLGWSTFAQAFAYQPGGAGAARPCLHRPPAAGLDEVAPGTYRLAPDVVVEPVAAGLWIRPADQRTDPAGARRAPLDPRHNLLLYEATDPTRADRMRELAERLANQLDETIRPATRLVPSTALLGTSLTRHSGNRPGPSPAQAQDAPASPQGPTPSTWPAARPEGSTAPASAASAAPSVAAGTAPLPRASEPDLPNVDSRETDLPWLSRLMETMSVPVPVPVLPSEVERRDDRADR